jgi:hypothetical protein
MPSSVQRYDETSDYSSNGYAHWPELFRCCMHVTIVPVGPIGEEDLFDSLITQASA